MSEFDGRDAEVDGRGRATPKTGRAVNHDATKPQRGKPGRRAAAETSRIARTVLDLLIGEIMLRLKRRFPDPATASGGRRRQRAEVVSSAVSPRRTGGVQPRRRARVARVAPGGARVRDHS
jgi:hypothetical protein